VLFTPLQAWAVEDVYSERTVEIGRNLACPVCEGQTVADSHSRVALEMMLAIEAQVEAGQTDEQIYDYFRVRYGEEVLIKPPREGINLALWWLPVAAVVIGLVVVGLYFRDSSALGRRVERQPAAELDQELEQLARRVLNDPDVEPT
jgi:cytochrome c-type biogenesis protein CcmH